MGGFTKYCNHFKGYFNFQFIIYVYIQFYASIKKYGQFFIQGSQTIQFFSLEEEAKFMWYTYSESENEVLS